MDFNLIKNDILGEDYDLSLAFISAKKSREINKTYRKKNKPTNVLSFPLSKTEGEILICKEVAKKEASKFDKTLDQFIGFLVIHGLLHLKGMQHGSIMEKAEKKYDQKYFYRNRRGLINDKSRGGRISKRRKKS
ncbi:MAG: rRNA maturation RNase YbeY [Candidatus Paceibacterota bacterium]|jgi:probable rRNA maturation factor